MRVAPEFPAADVVKRMFYLAYNAASVVGMGVFQAKNGVTEDDVMRDIVVRKERDGASYHGDYVYGRMMKCHIEIVGEEIELRDGEQRSDYQSWCGKYPTYKHLYDAAIQSFYAEETMPTRE